MDRKIHVQRRYEINTGNRKHLSVWRIVMSHIATTSDESGLLKLGTGDLKVRIWCASTQRVSIDGPERLIGEP